jgi:hypothetical protein
LSTDAKELCVTKEPENLKDGTLKKLMLRQASLTQSHLFLIGRQI